MGRGLVEKTVDYLRFVLSSFDISDFGLSTGNLDSRLILMENFVIWMIPSTFFRYFSLHW